MPNLDQLRAFVTAVDTGSFSAAARQLGKAQSAISTAIINLEIDTGVELFDRSRRNPTPTSSGTRLLRYARNTLRSSDEFHAQASSINTGVEKSLGVAIEQGIFVHSLMDVFDQLGEAFPHLQLELFDPGPREVADLLKSGRADIGVMIEQESYPQGFHFRGIGHSQLIPVCSPSHPLAALKSVSYADLRQHRQLISHCSAQDSEAHQREQVSPRVWTCEGPFLVMDLVLPGLGWSELPWTVVSEKLDTGELHRLRYDYQQSRILQGVDVVWTDKRALGPSGQWLQQRLLDLPPELWTEQLLA